MSEKLVFGHPPLPDVVSKDEKRKWDAKERKSKANKKYLYSATELFDDEDYNLRYEQGFYDDD
jgi:hypothetical protein